MMTALADAMVEAGYGATTVADVLRRAGVSRETFYQHFSSKQDCFLQTFDAAAAGLLAVLDGDARALREASRAERFERLFGRYLDLIVESPAYARLFLVESYAAGPAAIERRAAVQARLVDGMVEALGLRRQRDRFAAEVLVAAVGSLVTAPLVAGDVAAVAALRDPVLALADDLFR